MRSRLPLVLRILVTSGLLYYILGTVPVAGVVPAIRSARIDCYAIALLLVAGMNYAASRRMKLFTDLQGMSLSVRSIYGINLAATFYGLFLPGSLAGGAIRWHKLYKPDRNAAGAFVSILFNRLILTTATAGLGVVFWALAPPGTANEAVGLGLKGIFVGLLILQGVLLHDKVASLGAKALEGKPRIPDAVRRGLGRLVESAAQCRNLPAKTLLLIVAASVAEELLGVLSYYFVALSLGVDISLVNIGWIRSCLMLVTMLPISISGFGVREGSLIVLLGPLGISGEDAVALSLLLFSRTLLMGGAGGVVEAWHFFSSGRDAGGIERESS